MVIVVVDGDIQVGCLGQMVNGDGDGDGDGDGAGAGAGITMNSSTPATKMKIRVMVLHQNGALILRMRMKIMVEDGAVPKLARVLQIGLVIVGGKREIRLKVLMEAIGVGVAVVDKTTIIIIPGKLSPLRGVAVKVVLKLVRIGIILSVVIVVVGMAAMGVGMLVVAVGVGVRKVGEAGMAVGVAIETVELLVVRSTEVDVEGVVMAVDVDMDTNLITVEVMIPTRKLSLVMMADGAVLILVQVLQIGQVIVGGKRAIGLIVLMGEIGVAEDMVDKIYVMIIPRKLSPLGGVAVKVVVPFVEIGITFLVGVVVVGMEAMRVGMLVVSVGIAVRKVGEAGVAAGVALAIEKVEVLVVHSTDVDVEDVVMAADMDATLITLEVIIPTRKLSLVDGLAMEGTMPEVEIGVIVVMVILVVGLAATRVEILPVAVGMTVRNMEEESWAIGVAGEVGDEVAIGVEVMGVDVDVGMGVASVVEGMITITMEVILDIIPPPGAQIPKIRVEMMMGLLLFLVIILVVVIGVLAVVTLVLEMLRIAVGVAVEELGMLVAAIGVELIMTLRVFSEVVLQLAGAGWLAVVMVAGGIKMALVEVKVV